MSRVLVRGLAAATAWAAVITLLAAAHPTATGAATSSVHPTRIGQCTPADLTATLVLSQVGSSSTSLAGAVIFSSKSSVSCTLKGVPRVRVIGSGGQAVPVSQAPMFLRRAATVTLSPPRSSLARPDAGVSITWSDWGCATGSFALEVQFSGWSGPITAPYGSAVTGTTCDTPATLYVGPVARAATPA